MSGELDTDVPEVPTVASELEQHRKVLQGLSLAVMELMARVESVEIWLGQFSELVSGEKGEEGESNGQ